MLPGPIFAVEMLTSGRRRRYYVLRVVYALVLLAGLVSTYQSIGFGRAFSLAQNANLAAAFFQTFSIMQILAVLTLGPALVAGTVAVERERRTIEYLFATDLSNAEIVLGKLLARFLLLAYAMVVGLPILALTMLLGGVSPVELGVVFVVTASTMFCVSALAIGVSVWSPRVRDAMARIYVFLFAILVLPGALLLPLGRELGLAWIVDPICGPLIDANPVWVLMQMVGMRAFSMAGSPWPSVSTMVALQTGLAVVIAAWATWAVRRVHLARTSSGEKRISVRGRMQRRNRRRMSPRAVQPMFWKEMVSQRNERFGILGRIVLGLLAIAAVLPSIFMLIRQPVNRYEAELTVIMATVVICGGLLLLGVRAAGAFTSEKEKDTWVTLLSTPLVGREIVWGKAAGVAYSLRWLLLVLSAIWLIQIVRTPSFLISIPLTLLAVGLLAAFVVMLGLRFSLTARNSTRAFAITISSLLVLGGGYFICCAPMLCAGGPGPDRALQLVLAPCMPFLISFQGILAVESGRPEGEIVAAYALGMLGYAIATFVLTSHLVADFDRLAERTTIKR